MRRPKEGVGLAARFRWGRGLGVGPLRLYPEHKGFTLFIGPWFCRFGWAKHACFGNGSRWWSGIHRWADD